MDYQFSHHQPTAIERSTIDRILGEYEPTAPDLPAGQIAVGGVGPASERRHLLLPLLRAVQEAAGWVSQGAINHIGRRLPVSPAEAYGVAEFYHLIATEPRPPKVAHVCDDVACAAAGADRIIAELERALGPPGRFDGPSAWCTSPCLGQCDQRSAAYVQVTGGDNLVLAPATAQAITDALSGPAATEASPSPSIRQAGPVLDFTSRNPDRTSDVRLPALEKALTMQPRQIVDEIERSGLRGRGGAAFPAGVKWQAVADGPGPKYVVCNADESEPGTFKDRVLLESDPLRLVEAMAIAGYATDAERGYVYLRGEYELAFRRLEEAVRELRATGIRGTGLGNTGFSFDVEIRRGAGAYVCGEETALFNSIEGRRGEPRQKPPFPTDSGLFGRPTLVHNVESLMNVPGIVMDGGQAFASTGTEESTGSRLFCVSGNVAEPGVYEVELGITVRNLISLAGGVVGEPAAVLVGGAAGRFLTPIQFDVPLTFEHASEAGFSLGSGAIVVFNTDVDMQSIVVRLARFFSEESCGLCIPCRVGTVRQLEALQRLSTGSPPARELELLAQIDVTLREASICGLGQLAGAAVQSAIDLGLMEHR